MKTLSRILLVLSVIGFVNVLEFQTIEYSAGAMGFGAVCLYCHLHIRDYINNKER